MDASAAQMLGNAHPLIWIAWLVYWKISARQVKALAREESVGQRLTHSLPTVLAVLLFCFSDRFPLLRERLYPESFGNVLAGTILLVAGLALAVCARVVLGRNWSATVAVKEDHELIQTGPYRWARHPIYTGILAGFAGSAMAIDSWGAALAVALVFAGFWFKLLREEAWMRETFGETYSRYCARTARLIPFVL